MLRDPSSPPRLLGLGLCDTPLSFVTLFIVTKLNEAHLNVMSMAFESLVLARPRLG